MSERRKTLAYADKLYCSVCRRTIKTGEYIYTNKDWDWNWKATIACEECENGHTSGTIENAETETVSYYDEVL